MKIPCRPSVAFAACCFIFAAVPCNAADDKTPKPPPLAVVRTWGELVAQKPVMVQPPYPEGQPAAVRCKLGISSTTGEHYGGVVLYCLEERNSESRGDAAGGEEALGPFMVNVFEPGTTGMANLQEVARVAVAVKPGATYLFMRTILLDKLGDYHIEVRQAMDDGKKSGFKPVAAATVKVGGGQGAFWSPWSDPDKDPGDNSTPDEGNFSLMEVANPAGGVALPYWKGWRPVFIAKMPGGKSPLPQIIPAGADPGIQLSVKGSQLTVKLADDEIPDLESDDYFLTRWWVNGKPFRVKVDATQPRTQRALEAAEKPVKEVRFQMEFHPERLGAKKGDTVAVQLLYCPEGWRCFGMLAMMKAELMAVEDETKPEPWRISRMSNKVEFVYSRGPASVVRGAAP